LICLAKPNFTKAFRYGIESINQGTYPYSSLSRFFFWILEIGIK